MTRTGLTCTLLTALALSACGGGGGNSSASITLPDTQLTLSLTDAAVDSASRVLVQFAGISVKPAGDLPPIDIPLEGTSQTCNDLLDDIPPAATPPGEATIRCFDLLELQGDNSAVLVDAHEIGAGQYDWVRLAVQAERGVMDSIIVLDDGGEESLWIPSGSQSGLKLNSPFNIAAEQNNHLLIDFDLRKSVNNPQGFPDYRLKPSLRLLNLGEIATGSMGGAVQASLLNANGCTDAAAVYIYQGSDPEIGDEGSENAPLTSAVVALDNGSGQWRYEAGFLEAGTYTALFTCRAADDSPENAGDDLAFVNSGANPVQVSANEQSTVNFGPGGN